MPLPDTDERVRLVERLLAAAPVATFYMRRSGSDELVLVGHNEAALAFGPQVPSLVGQRVADLASWGANFLALADTARGSRIERQTVRYASRATDKERVLRATCVEIEPGFVLGFAEDLSGTDELRARLAETQHLEAVGRLAGGVAHDFNNLLTSIVGAAEGAVALTADAAILDELATIRVSALRAAELTRQLVAFAGKQVLQLHEMTLAEVMLDLEDLLRRALPANIAVRVERAPDAWKTRVDAAQVQRFLLDLALAARDAMPDGGELVYTLDNVSVGPAGLAEDAAAPPGEFVRICVKDTGRGMAPEIAARAFEPFFHAASPGCGAATKRGSSGLGLASGYGFVRQIGGAVSVHSVVGDGTAFCIYLPRAPSSGPVSRPPITQAGRGERILVAEDELLVRNVVVRTLRAAGFEVVAACDGEEALAMVLADPRAFDLLVSDVVMPKLGGPGLARAVREARPDVKVLFVSGYADAAFEGAPLPVGAAFLAKPFTAGELVSTARRVLDE